jgi:SAM-dependent methyltransferase
MTDSHGSRSVQDRYFTAPDVERFRWMTEDPAFAPVEDALLEPWLGDLGFPCLEIGCGEGSNLVRLTRRGACVGLDLYPERVRFAARAVPGTPVTVGDACRLPFGDGAFVGVLIRDLLHHLPEPRRALDEAVRMLRPGGSLLLLEPNGRNPFNALQARLIAAERGVRESTPERLRALLDGLALESPRIDMTQGFPLRRLALHYRFGLPGLGRTRIAAAAFAGIERIGERLTPRRHWSYVVLRAQRAAR